MKDWELPADEIAKLPRPRAIAAIAEGVINEFGEEQGPLRLCLHTCQTFIEHPGDPAYIQDHELWTKTVNKVCARRGISFDAELVCCQMVSEAWKTAWKKGGSNPMIPQTFEQRISETDATRARGWGISLD